MSRWPHDDPASLAAFYGDPEHGEPGRQLVPVVPPFTMYYAGKPIQKIMFHRKAAGALSAALNEIYENCQRSQAKVDKLRLSVFSGAYNPRYVRGYEPGNAQGRTPRWSNHAYGAAIDFDADHNGFNTGHGTMPQLAVDAFKRQGALWGGDYKGRTDPMHFEFCSRDPVIRPSAFADLQVDGDSDAAGDRDDAPLAKDASKPSAGGFFSRARNWVTGLLSGGGIAGLGALTDFHIAALLIGTIVGLIVLGFVVSLWLFGKKPVADWVARHVA